MNPSREQLKEVIVRGNDKVDNILILRTDELFEIIQAAWGGAVEHLEYMSRWETFDRGNDYVGIYSSNDNWLIDKLMKWADEMWKIYKNTGKLILLIHIHNQSRYYCEKIRTNRNIRRVNRW